MKKFLLFAFCVSLMTAFIGCSTASISKSLQNIPIPGNLDQSDAKAAVVFAISTKPLPEASNWQKIVAGALASQGFGSGLGRNTWFIESVEPDAVIYGYKRGEYYIRVRLTITNRQIVPTIEDSKNLKQHKDKIHEGALGWVDALCINVRATLGNFSRVKAGFPNG